MKMMGFKKITKFMEGVYNYLVVFGNRRDLELTEIVNKDEQKVLYGLHCIPHGNTVDLMFTRDEGQIITDPGIILFSSASLPVELRRIRDELDWENEVLYHAGEEVPSRMYDLIEIMEDVARPRRDLNGDLYHIPNHSCDSLSFVPSREGLIYSSFDHGFEGDRYRLSLSPEVSMKQYLGHSIHTGEIKLHYQDREILPDDVAYLSTFFQEIKAWYETLGKRELI